MKQSDSYDEELIKEMKQLNRLIERALRGPIAKNEEIIEQRKKVDRLIEKDKRGTY